MAAFLIKSCVRSYTIYYTLAEAQWHLIETIEPIIKAVDGAPTDDAFNKIYACCGIGFSFRRSIGCACSRRMQSFAAVYPYQIGTWESRQLLATTKTHLLAGRLSSSGLLRRDDATKESLADKI